MIEQCYDCKFARNYVAWWWFPYYDPICDKGEHMNKKEKCKHFKLIGRRSR